MPELTPLGSECVPAGAVDESLQGGEPVCQCQFDSESPASDSFDRINATYTIGLEKSRTLLGQAAGACEAAGPYQWMGSAFGYEECVFTSDEFLGCSLVSAATSCESTCTALRERQEELARVVRSRYEPLLDECRSFPALERCGNGACVGAFRVGQHCYRGVVDNDLEVFHSLQEIDCSAPPENALEALESDYFTSVSFCAVDINDDSRE
jgi:hypothetical protein